MKPILTKYLEMFISMATDCLMGGITIETFISNAEIAIKEMRKELTP